MNVETVLARGKTLYVSDDLNLLAFTLGHLDNARDT